MSHEIYYTSAPEGLKPSTSGFCTVAASDNIPKPLWDRLESLSAYRHHFTTASGNPGENPVSFAHWLLSIAGVSYHVLSRVCDSGVDHTQRTNAFADHLVLDNAEMTPAGPAWMLTQNTLAKSWDGTVGTLPPRSLPQGDIQPAICHAWKSITGDAGWAGHLADIFVKSPTKPVCILFSPGQQILPLLAEAIALLPPTARWNVTFNTYFTSMPTSATCAWRCCLAGTPAAQLAMRYAAAGLILDLTDPSRLGIAPDGPYATLARTGIAPPSIAKNLAAPPRPLAGRPAVKSPKPEGPFELADPNEPEEPTAPRPSPFSQPALIAQPAAPFVAPAHIPAPQPPIITRPSRPMKPIMKNAEAALRKTEISADQAAARRRKQFVYLFFGALAALAFGMTLVMIAMRNTAPPELPTIIKQPDLDPTPTTFAITPPKPITPPPIIPKPIPAPIPTTQIVTPITPIPAPTPQPPAIKFPAIIKLADLLKKPTSTTGIGDILQSLPFPPADLDPASPITAIKFLFPPPLEGKLEYADPAGSSGVIIASSESAGSKHKISIRWKNPEEIGPGTELLFITFNPDRSHPSIDLTWKISALTSRPDSVSLVYWIMLNSAIELQPPRGPSQKIYFRPYDPPALSLTDPQSNFAGFPADLPRQVEPVLTSSLPDGWKTAPVIDHDKSNSVLMSVISHGLKFEKSGDDPATDPYFIVMFDPTYHKLDNSFSQRLAAEQENLDKAQDDLNNLTTQINDARKKFGPGAEGKGMDELLARQAAAQKDADRYNASIAGYNQFKQIDISLAMPGGMRLVTFHLRRTEK